MSEDKNAELTAIDGGGEGGEAQVKPLFHVVKGNPTDEEIGVLTVVLAAAAGGGEEDDRFKVVDKWGDIAERLDRHTFFNPGAFRNARYY